MILITLSAGLCARLDFISVVGVPRRDAGSGSGALSQGLVAAAPLKARSRLRERAGILPSAIHTHTFHPNQTLPQDSVYRLVVSDKVRAPCKTHWIALHPAVHATKSSDSESRSFRHAHSLNPPTNQRLSPGFRSLSPPANTFLPRSIPLTHHPTRCLVFNPGRSCLPNSYL